MTDVFTQQNYSNSQLEDLKAAEATIDNSGDFPVVQQQQKTAEPTATSTTTISSVTTKTPSNVDADIKAQIKKLGKELKSTLRQQFSALSNKHQARLHEDASAHVADNEPLIRPATTLTSMKTLGGCVFVDVDIKTFEATAKKSFESDAVRGDFATVFQRTTFIPSRDSGDKFDAVLAYRSKGGSVHEEQRDAIVEWQTTFAHELFGEDATTPKTLAQYRSFRGVAKPRTPSSGSKKRKSAQTDTVVVDGEDDNAANDATSESENAVSHDVVATSTKTSDKNDDADSMSSDDDNDEDDKAVDGNDDDEESASLDTDSSTSTKETKTTSSKKSAVTPKKSTKRAKKS
jgi:hypothetical protein